MNRTYEKLQDQISSDLLEVSVAPTGSAVTKEVQESHFEPLPIGSRVKLRSVSFSKLAAGDYILVVSEGRTAVRRFVRISMCQGLTRLVVVDGLGGEEEIPFTRLIGLVQKVRSGNETRELKAQNVFQRIAFKLSYRWSRLQSRGLAA